MQKKDAPIHKMLYTKRKTRKNKFLFSLFCAMMDSNIRQMTGGVIMAKLYFKYGSMGSSKTAQALIAKFNYEERGMNVWLIKPQLDTRDGAK